VLPFDPDAAPALPLLLDSTYFVDRSRGHQTIDQIV
jgi:hypothetical protein